MSLSYGTSGLKHKDYRVYIADVDTANLQDNLDSWMVDIPPSTVDLELNVLSLMGEIGECRADSISAVSEDGDSIEGNVAGNIVINKNCSFSVELINTTKENIDALEALDSVSCLIILVERDQHLVSGTAYKTVVIMNYANVSYSENATGGDTIRSMINVSKSVNKVTDFRTILDAGV